MEREDVIRKIKKMMAIANDPAASDQEIQLASYRANKLRIRYKLEDKDLFQKSNCMEDVIDMRLQNKGIGYIHWVLNKLTINFQCESAFIGRINSINAEFAIIGLKEDVELCLPVAEGVVYFLNSILEDLKNCYIGSDDFRLFRRSYLSGFADGLDQQLTQAKIEMHLEPKYEIAVFEVPAVVKDFMNHNVKIRKQNTKLDVDLNAWHLGQKHGLEYDIERKDLLG